MFSTQLELARKIVIEKSPQEVFRFLIDFKNWASWSPWIHMEEDCRLSIEGTPGTVGHAQSWEGQLIGSGKMTLVKQQSPSLIEINLEFFKPWKSKSLAIFRLTPETRGTKVVWEMQGQLPFFMFFFKKMMAAFIGGDYDRGLRMLKEKLETGDVLSHTEVKGMSQRTGFQYIGIQKTCKLDEIGQVMPKDFERLQQLIQSSHWPQPKAAVAFYPKFDMINQKCDYIAAITYDQTPSNVPADLAQGIMPQHLALQVDHWGPYRNIGNAWSTAMAILRAEKMKTTKVIPPYEIYRTMPGQVNEAKIHTEIISPLKD